MKFKYCTLFLYVTTCISIQSCFSNEKYILPEYNKPVTEISIELSTLISFTNLSIRSKNEVTQETNPTAKLIIELEDTPLDLYTESQLERKSKDIARLIKKSIKNFNSFDLITVLYTPKNPEYNSKEAGLKVFAFRPSEIK